jgi:hypothetical protein
MNRFSLRAKADNPPEGTIEVHTPHSSGRADNQSTGFLNYSFKTPNPGGCKFLCCRKYLAEASNYLNSTTSIPGW